MGKDIKVKDDLNLNEEKPKEKKNKGGRPKGPKTKKKTNKTKKPKKDGLKALESNIITDDDIKKISKALTANAKMKKKGKSTDLTDNEIRLVYKMACAGIPEKAILKCLLLSEEVMRCEDQERIERYKDIKSVMELARVDRMTKLSETLYEKAIKGNITCLIFALKTQGRKYGWSEKDDDKDKDFKTSFVELIRDMQNDRKKS